MTLLVTILTKNFVCNGAKLAITLACHNLTSRPRNFLAWNSWLIVQRKGMKPFLSPFASQISASQGL